MQPSFKPRVLAIGLDGATWDLLDPLLAANRLPHLARLIAGGTRSRLRSCIQPSSEQAWSAFATGMQNGKFGLFGFYQRAPASYALEYVNATHRRAATLWRILSDRGLTSLVVNMPLAWPVEPVQGALVSGLMTPGLHSQFTYPASLKHDLLRELGEYIIDVDIERGDLHRDGGALDALAARVKRMSELQTAAAQWLAANRPDWDFLILVHRAPDILCHKYWRFQDPSHPLYNPAEAARWGSVIADAYIYLDAQLGALVRDNAGADTTVLILSDHGFGPLTHAVYLNRYFAQAGLLAYRPQSRSLLAPLRSALRAGVGKLNNPLLAAVKTRAFEFWPQLKGSLHYSMAYGNLDWSRTRAYAVGTMGNVYLNVRGREPQGIVEPSAYESTRDQVIARMRELRDPDTAAPIFDFVYRREEIYHGGSLDLAPDVVGLIDGPYHVAAVDWRRQSQQIVQKVGSELLFVSDTSGQHRMDGILVAHGRQVRPNAPLAASPNLVDLAPTILHLLGQPVPEDMDGRVLQELLLDPAAVAVAPAGPFQPAQLDVYSEQEARTIEERLAGLGYLG